MQTRWFPRTPITDYRSLITGHCLLLLLSLAPLAQAQTTLNFNVANGDWHAAGNWSPAQVPTSADTAQINGGRTATIQGGNSGGASVLRIADGDGQTGTLNVNGGLTVAGSVTVGRADHWQGPAAGTLNQGDNSTVIIGGSLGLGTHHGTGVFNQGSNTSVSVGGILTVGGIGAGSTAYTVPAAGTLTLGSDLRIAYGDGGRGTFTYNNPSVALNVPGSVTIAWAQNWQGMSSGTFNLGGNTTATIGGSLTVGSVNSQNENGGVMNVTNGATLAVAGATAIATASNSRGRFNVNGGTAVFGGALSIGADGQLNHNSGAVHLPRQTTVSTGGIFANTAGSLHVGIGGDAASGAFDKVTVSGAMSLGGELRVELEHYVPPAADTYTIVTRSGGTLFGVFTNAPVSGETYVLGAARAKVTYNADSVVLSEVEMAPGTLMFLATGVSNITTAAAEAYATLAGTNAEVCLVWDTTDKGTVPAAWGATNALGTLNPGTINGAAITGLATGTYYTCRFYGTNAASGEAAWSLPVTFRTDGPPLIATLPESGVTYNAAVLNGNVISTGGVPTTVRAYWAQTDQHPSYTGWEGTNDFGAIGEGATNCIAAGLAYNAAYVYRYYASNVYDEAWGEAESFATPLTDIQFNVASGDWNTATNWLPQQVPIALDTAIINGGRTATIQGGDSGVCAIGRVGYGYNQTGTLTVDGTLTAFTDLVLGWSDNGGGQANGTINIGNNAAVNVIRNLTLGSTGNGRIIQAADSAVAVGGILTVGGGWGSSANTYYTVPATGTLSLSNDLRIAYGYAARGTFSYSNATVALTVPGNLWIGYSSNGSGPSVGTFNQADNTSVHVAGNVTLGSTGNGTFNQGTNTGVIVGGHVTVGEASGTSSYAVPATGTLTLSGPQSDLRIAYGYAARGTFTYSNATVALTVPGNLWVGYSSNQSGLSAGTFNQADNTTVTIAGNLTLGSTGDGTYNQGTNTTLTLGGHLTIGNGWGSGSTYTVPATGGLTLSNPAASLYVGYGYNGRGTFTYNGTIAALTVPGNVVIGWSSNGGGPSSGTFNQGENTAVSIGGTLTVGDANSATGNGGVYNVTNGATLTVTGATAIATAGNSRGRLNLDGDAAVFHGNLAIGADGRLNHNSGAVHLPRQTTTSGTFAHTAGSLRFGIGGDPSSGAYDKVTVNGGVMTLAGELQVELEGGYKPEQTNSYPIVTRSGGVLWGTFANAPVSGGRYRLGGMEAQVTYDANSVVLSEWREAQDGMLLIVR